MKNLSIILACILIAMLSCTKSKEVHPELGDGNDEIVMVGMKDVHVEYTRTDHAELQKVVFHYSLAEVQQFAVAEMTKQEEFFELTLNDLLSDTLYDYYYELFYNNSGEISITEQKTFHTQAFDMPEPPTPPSGAPEGAINGLFTINENGDRVYFSQGNLQYRASTNTWRFAEHQWECTGIDNENASSNYDGWIDLFGWGTSGYDHGAVCFQPWSTSTNDAEYNVYGSLSASLNDFSGLADWGCNAVINGGNAQNQWRTLTHTQWNYVLFDRNTRTGIRFVFAVLNEANGVIVLPDDWDGSLFNLNTNIDELVFTNNILSESQWIEMEQHGAVFLPTGGYRYGTFIVGLNYYGYYWSTTFDPDLGIGKVFIAIDFGTTYGNRFEGCSVRLVQDAR